MARRLYENWVYGGFLAGLLLLSLTPLFWGLHPDWVVATYLALPVYMLHQYEEHDADRFRRFVNDKIATGRRGLSVADVFWINVLGVWAVLAAALSFAVGFDPAWALVAAYLLVINAAVHVVQAIGMRVYNPGLVTAVALFLPVAAWIFAATPSAGAGAHVAAAGAVVALHGVIVLRAARSAS